MSLWRDIRALRADPPGLAATDVRREEFSASLQQAEEFAVAASAAGYPTKPLQLYYALAQGFRAVCAARLEADWHRVGHGLSVSMSCTDAPLEAVVKPAYRGLDLHRGAMAAIGEEPLPEPMSIAELMSALVEFRDFPIAGVDLPRPLCLMSPLQRHHVLGEVNQEPAPLLLMAIAGLPPDSDPGDLKKAIGPYPALEGAEPTAWPDGSYRMGGIKAGGRGTSDRGGVAYFHADVPGAPFPVFSLPFNGDRSKSYREAFERLGISHPQDRLLRIAQPGYGKERFHFGALCPWWALLLGLSSLARYHAPQWAGALALDSEPVTPALERVIDLAEEVIPLYLLDALTARRKRTPVLDDGYIVRDE